MRAGLINIVDNEYIVLELLSSFAVRNAQKTSEFILIDFHDAPLESYALCHFNYLPR